MLAATRKTKVVTDELRITGRYAIRINFVHRCTRAHNTAVKSKQYSLITIFFANLQRLTCVRLVKNSEVVFFESHMSERHLSAVSLH